MGEERKGVALSRALKGIAFSVAGLLLGAGLCGLDAHLYPRAEFGGTLGLVGLVVLGLSALVFVGSVLALVVAAVMQASRK